MRPGELSRAISEIRAALPKLWHWIADLQQLATLVPSSILAAFGVGIARDQGFGHIQTYLLGIVVWGAVAFFQQFFKPLSAKLVSGAVIIVGAFLFYRWAGDHYEISFEEAHVYVDRAIAKDGTANIGFIKLGVRLKNPNHFPIYYTSKLRLISIEDRVSQDAQKVWGGKINAQDNNVAIMDDSKVVLNVPESQVNSGRVLFILCYGRDKDDQHKSLVVKGPVVFTFNADGTLAAVPAIENDDEASKQWQCP